MGRVESLVITDLAEECAALEDRLVEATQRCRTYQELLSVSLSELALARTQLEHARDRAQQLLDARS